jgi:hypothetical protein
MIVSACILLALVAFVVMVNVAARREDRRRASLPPEVQEHLKAQHESDMQTFGF